MHQQSGENRPAERLELQAENNELIAHRVRVGLLLMLAAELAVVSAEAALPGALPAGIWWTHATAIPFGLGAYALFRWRVVRADPVPWTLAFVVAACASRVLFATLRGDILTTVFMSVTLAIAAGGALPWGVRAQAIAALCGAATIGANAWLVTGSLVPGSGREAIGIAAAFVFSIVLAFDRERHRRHVETETLARRRSEAQLAELNAALEQRVRQRTAELEAVVENSGNAIWSVDRDGRVRLVNRAGRARYAARYGQPFPLDEPGAAVPPATRAEMHALYARAFAGEHLQVERRLDGPDGVRHMLVSAHPIVEDGTVTGATLQSTDITEHRRAEEQARQHQAELAHVLRVGTMGEMAAGLAHEINQPIGAVANYALGALRRVRDGALRDEDLAPLFETIAAEALRAGDIIRRIRELLRKETPEYGALDPNEVARAAVLVAEGEAHRHHAHIVLDLASPLPAVHGNAIQLEQVLLNLLLNAVEACADGAPPHLVLRTAAVDGAVEVTLTDDGPGLPPAPADVFAPFFTTKPHGLGMGLAISRSIIELHGGTLEGRSNPSGGSTFRLRLPVAAG